MVNKYKLGLVIGSFIGFMHLVRALMIAIFPTFMQNLINRIFGLHFIQPIYTLTPATRSKGILLVVVTFAVGFVGGMIFGCIRNNIMKQAKAKAIGIKKPVAKAKKRK